MKNISILLLFVFTMAGTPRRIGATEQPALKDNLKPLKTYLGDWNMCWTDSNGQHITGKATLQPDAGGAIVTFKAELLDADGKPLFSRVSVFFWNSESNCLGESNFDSAGWHGANVLATLTGNKWIWKGGGYSGEGKEGRSVTQMIRVNESKWTAQFTNQTYNGEKIPDSPKITFTKIR